MSSSTSSDDDDAEYVPIDANESLPMKLWQRAEGQNPTEQFINMGCVFIEADGEQWVVLGCDKLMKFNSNARKQDLMPYSEYKTRAIEKDEMKALFGNRLLNEFWNTTWVMLVRRDIKWRSYKPPLYKKTLPPFRIVRENNEVLIKMV